jgi:hypothetical protein
MKKRRDKETASFNEMVANTNRLGVIIRERIPCAVSHLERAILHIAPSQRFEQHRQAAIDDIYAAIRIIKFHRETP